MPKRQSLVAGVLVATLSTAALLAWVFDVPAAKTAIAGWRVMRPLTALSFGLIGAALMLAATCRRLPSQALALVAGAIAAVSFTHDLIGIGAGWYVWIGSALRDAERTPPVTSICVLVLAASVVASTDARARARVFARLGSTATLMASWFAVLVLSVDAWRVTFDPRFTGMSLLTVVFLALGSWGVLAMTLDGEDLPARSISTRAGGLIALAFALPLVLGWTRLLTRGWLSQEAISALLLVAVAFVLAAVLWNFIGKLNVLQQQRAVTLGQLEQHVAERTAELEARYAAVKQSEDLLRDADRRKDEFLAILAHELRNPLAPIRNAVALLRAEAVTEADRIHARAIIDRQVTHMARLIDDLLDVSRIAAGKLPLHRAPVLLPDLLNAAVAIARPHLDRARHRFTVAVPRERIVVNADETRMSEVFANLLLNACKYTEAGGDIVLAVSQPNDEEVAISVRDNGIGIPPEFLPRLFDTFSQVDAALERSQGGLGIGLALVRGVVTLHGGRVEARSAGVGMGSEFTVYLPVESAAIETAYAPEPEPVVASVARRVLVVDDNEDAAESMALLLRVQGHIVDIAHDGIEALEVAERTRPDAVLLDLGLPQMNGYDVCRRLRDTAWGKSIVIVAQTGWGQEQDRIRTQQAGFDAHLTKPIDLDEIGNLLHLAGNFRNP